MNMRISYVNLTGTTFENAAGEETYNFSITLSPQLSGLIREDSVLAVKVTDKAGTEFNKYVQCYNEGSLITQYVISDIVVPNDGGDNNITSITLDFDYLDDLWQSINFTYGGSMTERFQFVHTLT